jgi:hypothetical protein
MNTIISIVSEIKKVYLNSAADLSQLITLLEDELELQGSPFDEVSLEELLSFCKVVTADITKNNTRSSVFARLHNKLDPPLHLIKPKRKTPHLRLVR